MKPFDTDKMPWLFTPHGDGDLNEYFSSDHSKVISKTFKEVIASLSESRDRLSGKLCYEFHYNPRRYKNTLLRFADMMPDDHQKYIQWNGERFIHYRKQYKSCCVSDTFRIQGRTAGLQGVYGTIEAC